MPPVHRSKLPVIKLKELCERLLVDYDEARYTLARGVLPQAITKSEPGRGNHRLFDANQAFYLAVCLKLKAAGVRTDLAASISDWSRKIQEYSQNGGWDYGFAPFMGKLETDHQWFLEVGDGRYVRLATDANPSREGLEYSRWTELSTRRAADGVQPAVIFRVDVGLIAQQLRGSTLDAPPLAQGGC